MTGDTTTFVVLALAILGATPGARLVNRSLALPPGQQGAAAAGLIEKQAISPIPADKQFYISPSGGHVAAIVPRGSRFAVFADGVEEPRFDEILQDREGSRIQFSPDNARHAYMAKQGDEYVAMVDGKEIARVPVAGTRAASLATPQMTPAFTPNGKHTYFLARIAPKAGGVEGDRLWWDGVPVRSPLPDVRGVVLSPDGEHFAMSVSGAQNKEAVVVDGKLFTLPGGNPVFTADGHHLITDAQIVNSLDHQLFVDGKPWVKGGALVRTVIPPAGDIAAAVVGGGTPYQSFVVVGTTRVEASVSQTVNDVYFSPDGKHYAITCQTETGRRFVVVDGKKGLDYEALVPLQTGGSTVIFSSDSAHSMYLAQSGKNHFLVVDGVESDGYPNVQDAAFSGDGKRFGFLASGGDIINGPSGATMQRWAVIDGKPTRADGQVLQALQFSLRGGHYAYIAGSNANPRLVVDGAADTKSGCCAELGSQLVPRFVFSGDGAHVAHVSPSRDGAGQAVVIDGKAVATIDGYISNLTFTPDGRHVLWLRHAGGREPLTIYVDGKPAVRLEYSDSNARLLLTRGAWDMNADGVLTAFAQEGDSMQRVRVRPPSDSNVDALLGVR